MTFRFTILGCGTSTGVPRIGPIWGACDPENPKNRRSRCSLLVERISGQNKTTVLVDTTPDMRQQLLAANVSWLDGVVYSHDHADHTHGIDDLRAVFFNGRQRVDLYHDRQTGKVLQDRFSYCFEQPSGSNYPAIVRGNNIQAGTAFQIEGNGGAIEVLPFIQEHGDTESLGFRFGGLAYSTDVAGLPNQSYELLAGTEIWVLDALRYTPHPSHFSVEQALAAIEYVKPRRAILTHMHIDLDYEELRSQLPDGVEPAFDGLVIETEG